MIYRVCSAGQPRILNLTLGSGAGNFSKSPGHFPERDVMGGEGGGIVLENPEFTPQAGHKT